MPDIFISYAREDAALRDILVRCLEHGGWVPFYDENLTPGKSFNKEIEERIRAYRLVVVIWTQTSVQSNWLLAEAQAVLDGDKLFPVLMGNTADAAKVEVRLQFCPFHALSLTDRGRDCSWLQEGNSSTISGARLEPNRALRLGHGPRDNSRYWGLGSFWVTVAANIVVAIWYST